MLAATRGGLAKAFDGSLRANAHRTAVEFGRTVISYAQLSEWIAAIGSNLHTNGIVKGDKVGLLVGNDPSYIAADIALAMIGAVKVPISDQLPAHVITHVLMDSSACALVVEPRLEALAIESIAGLPILLIGFGTPMADGVNWVRIPDAHDINDDLSWSLDAGIEPCDQAALYYTGGTTGFPKGVVHSHESILNVHIAQLLEAEIRQQDRLLLTTPLTHAAGMFAGSAILRGATIVLHQRFDVDETLVALDRDRVTWTFMVPTMLYRLLDAIGDSGTEWKFPALETVVYGAAPIAPSRLRQALSAFGQVFIQLYGQTECPNWGTRLSKLDHDPGRPERMDSCGQASLMAEVKVVDDVGDDVPVGEIGEVCLRSPYLMTEYHGNPEATAGKFLEDWILTGDIGVLDGAGYLYLKDRAADMIISGGMNVYSGQVEDVLNSHPRVRAAAVIGVPHSEWGEAVHAIVVGEPSLTPEELMAWARDRLATYARPKTVELVDYLPETPFGKIDKKVLRSPHWEGIGRQIN